MADELVGEQIQRKRGDTVPDVITVLDAASTSTPKDPLDITGFAYVMTINTERDPDGSVGTELVTIVGAITDAAGGVVEFEWDDTKADQVPETYWYDIQQKDASGKIKTIAKNKYIFYQDITKST